MTWTGMIHFGTRKKLSALQEFILSGNTRSKILNQSQKLNVFKFRAALEGRTTRVAVVLIQNGPTIPAGDEGVTAERASTLCTTCELNAKNLFLLPHNDHLQGYTLRLENAFYDLAQSFYHQKVRTIRSHRDHLNKTTHQYLFVRHQFKMGFLNELKQDAAVANK
jgi:trafficking protein particle complex subunit 11